MAKTTLDEDPIYPTKKLVEFYKEKLKESRLKYLALMRDVKSCKELALESSAKEENALKLLAENSELQEALSELRRCLYKEREHSLRLNKDNDLLEIDKFENNKKIDFLLNLTGLSHKDLELDDAGLRAVGMTARRKVRFTQVTSFNNKIQKYKEDTLIEKYKLKISSLEAQLQEIKEHYEDEINSLKNDIEIREKEWEVTNKRLVQKISCLNCRLRNCQLFKFDEMDSYLEELDKNREREIILMEENDVLKRSLDICRELLGPDFPDRSKKAEDGLRMLREQVLQRDRVVCGYVEQNRVLREEIGELRHGLAAEKEGRTRERERMVEREEYYKKRIEEERRRRCLESEGFLADVKLLRSKLQGLERQIRAEQRRKRHLIG